MYLVLLIEYGKRIVIVDLYLSQQKINQLYIILATIMILFFMWRFFMFIWVDDAIYSGGYCIYFWY